MKTLTKRIAASIAVFAATACAAYAIKAIKADAYCGFTDPQLSLEYYVLTDVCQYSEKEAMSIMVSRHGSIETLYPKTFTVSAVDLDNDMVFLVDYNGNEWAIYGIEDWMEGDVASAIMSDNGTPDSIYDDKIVDIRYSGYLW
jgi:hypothetical protein